MLLNHSFRLVIWMNRLCSLTFDFPKVLRQHISGALVSLTPSYLHFIWECDSERIIKIGPHLRELWGIIMRARFFETQCICHELRCKDDQQSLWEKVNFDTAPTLNPLTDRHQIWHTWLCPRCLSPHKVWRNPLRGFFSPYTWNITPHVRYVYYAFLFFLVLPIAYSQHACMDFNA